MTAAEILSPEAEQSVAQIVLQDLEHIATEGISIDEVRITPGEDQYGDPYHHIVVVYSGNGDLLDPGVAERFQEKEPRQSREVGRPPHDGILRRSHRIQRVVRDVKP